MLTIENKDKIVNLIITTDWYVEAILEIVLFQFDNGWITHKSKAAYQIIIRNRTTKYFEEINLYRVKGIDNRWYELSCIRNGNKHTEFLSIKGIENIKALLHHIKIVGID
jgi:hypothetical protein